MATATDPTTERRNLAAELEVLEEYDLLRHFAGHDYGQGQRASELSRRRGLVHELGRRARLFGEDDDAPTDDELAAAFERIARPRMRRIEREDYRRSTPATTRTVATWRRVERRFAR